LCAPEFGFAGPNAIVAYCDGGGDGTGGINTFVSAFAGPNWRRNLDVPVTAQEFAVDRDATQVLLTTRVGLQVFPIAGGAGSTIDEGGVGGVFMRDGNGVLYTTSRHELKRSSIGSDSRSDATVLSNDAAALLSVSPDGKWAITASTETSTVPNAVLSLVSTVAPGPPIYQGINLSPADDAFTADSNHALFKTGPDGNEGLLAVPCRTDPTAVTLAKDGSGVAQARATSGSKVIFQTIATDDRSLWGADAALGVTERMLTNVDTVFLTRGKDHIVYTWHFDTGPRAGLWVMEAP
jgi:hypothetical protein